MGEDETDSESVSTRPEGHIPAGHAELGPQRPDEIEVSPPRRFDPGLAEEMADKLIDKREKLEYFIVTASTAIIVFTFNDFNNPNGLLQRGSGSMTLAGWLVLLLASALALYGLRARHWVYSQAIADMRLSHSLPPVRMKKVRRAQTRIIWASHLMWGAFVLGTAMLARSYSLALL